MQKLGFSHYSSGRDAEHDMIIRADNVDAIDTCKTQEGGLP